MRSHGETAFYNIYIYLFSLPGSEPVPLNSIVVSFLTFHGSWAENCGSNFPLAEHTDDSVCLSIPTIAHVRGFFFSPSPQQLSAWPVKYYCSSYQQHSTARLQITYLLTITKKSTTNPGGLDQSSDNRHCDQAWSSASQTHLRTGVLVLQLVICLMIATAKGLEKEIFKERSWLLTLRDRIKAMLELHTQSHFSVVEE